MDKRGKQNRRDSPGRKRTTKSYRAARSEMPSKSSITSTETFVSPSGRRYTILKTDQIDPYDDPKDSGRKGRGD